MTDEELAKIAAQVSARLVGPVSDLVSDRLIREQHASNTEVDENMLKTVALILKGFGIRAEDQEGFADDMRYLRKWRQGSERITSVGITAIITLFVGGMVSALWIGFKAMVGK